MPRFLISKLELHVTHACNLACESCSHYMNQGHKGNLALAEADRWMQLWVDRVKPKEFALLGGEPTIHPELPAFVRLVRRHFPETRIRVVSNAFFLDRQPDLPAALKEAGNAQLDISIHHGSDEYVSLVMPNLMLMEDWKRDHGIRTTVKESYSKWQRLYYGVGAEMAPFEDGEPRTSWENCRSKFCWQLHEGQIWKCPPLTYLKLQKEKYGLSEKWDPYLAYQPLSPDASDDAVKAFFLTQEESHCGMCPARPVSRPIAWPLPGRPAAS